MMIYDQQKPCQGKMEWDYILVCALYHAMSHGNERRNIVIDNSDRPLFLEILGKISEQYSIEMKRDGKS